MSERRTQAQINADNLQAALELVTSHGLQVIASQSPVAEPEIAEPITRFVPRLPQGDVGASYGQTLELKNHADGELIDMQVYISSKGFVCLKTKKDGPYMVDQNGNTWGSPSIMLVRNGKFVKPTDLTLEQWYDMTGQALDGFIA